MGHEIDLSKYTVRTDLAVDVVTKNNYKEIVKEDIINDNIKVTTTVINKETSLKINKKEGTYITLEFIDETDRDNSNKIIEILNQYLVKMLKKINIKKSDSCLVVGLGNANSTPDSLGPLVVDEVIVTNHLLMYGSLEEGYRQVFAIKPGVTGQTGIETSEIIKGVINNIKPDFVIFIDALASQSVKRVNKTIQMTDTGINPGSGIGNDRGELSFDTLNVPVIAIGIPTVVDAVTIVSDTLDYMHKHYAYTKLNINNPINKLLIEQPNYLKKDLVIDHGDKTKLLGIVGSLEESEIKQLIFEVLSPIGFNLMVTPKEVDFSISKLAKIIGLGINKTLHDKI